MPKPIPEGYTALTPYLMVPDVDAEIAFLKKAFGATSEPGMPGPDGRTMHGEAEIRGAKLMIGLSSAEHPPMPAMLYLYDSDVDATFARALAAGGAQQMPVIDQPWGDRAGSLKSPGGTIYWVASHTHDYTHEQIQQNLQAYMKPK